MKYELIKTEDYLLVVSDELPTKWYYDTLLKDVRSTSGAQYSENSITKKVLAHLPLNDAGHLAGVDVLPEIEDEVVKLFDEVDSNIDFSEFCFASFKLGYKKAKETYKYSEKDLRRAIGCGMGIELWKEEEQINNFIQSLNQPKLPVAFECEMEVKEIANAAEVLNVPIPKTITNSEGRTEWVGKYLFC